LKTIGAELEVEFLYPVGTPEALEMGLRLELGARLELELKLEVELELKVEIELEGKFAGHS